MLSSYAMAATVIMMLFFAQGNSGDATRHVPCSQSGPACGAALQAAIDAAPAGTTITLDAGKEYQGSLNIRPRKGATPQAPLVITTRGWQDKGAGWDGLVTPADKPRMATLRAAPGGHAAVTIPSGANAGHVTFTGVAFAANPPIGQGEVIRIGEANERVAATLAQHVVIRQVLIQGDREFGQKRAIAANGQDIEISQLWCEEIFVAGQDNQCIAAWNGGKRVRVHHSYLAAGAENILLGGAPVASAEMQPDDWLIEDVILHKPLRWRQDARNRQVKNLLEFKHGRNITVRRVLAVNNWTAAQDGRGLLLNYTTNGKCPDCGNLEKVLIEDFVMLNVDGGLTLQGHSWQPDSYSAGKLQDVTLRNVYMQLSKQGRVIQISDVLDRHNIRIERSTFVNEGPSWVVGSFGRAWRDDETIGAGGPLEGLTIVDNVFAANGEYGITAPKGQHFGSGIGAFVRGELQIAGNVIGDAPQDHLANYNRHVGTGEKNTSVSRDQLLKKLPARTCGQWAAGKGADCARLQPVFDLLRRLPEP